MARKAKSAPHPFSGVWMVKPPANVFFIRLLGRIGAAKFGHLGHPAESVSPRPLADRLGASMSRANPDSQPGPRPSRVLRWLSQHNTKSTANK